MFHGEIAFARLALIASRLDWRYEGVLHECLACDTPHHTEHLQGLRVRVHSDGARSQINTVQKYANDALVLEEALLTEPDNARYVFYLAQSYRDSGQWEKSLETYQRRAATGGWEEEVWYSLYETARISERLKLATAIIVERYLLAFQCRPQRAEPLAELARFHREHGQFALAHLFAARAMAIPKPDDLLFIDDPVYDWRSLDEYAIAAYWIGDYPESEKANRTLLANGRLPANQRPRVMENLNWALRKQGLPDYAPEPAEPRQPEADGPACPICATPAKHRYATTPYWMCPACDAWFQHPAPPKVYIGAHEPPPEDMPEDEREVNRSLARWLFADVMEWQAGAIVDIGAKLPVLAAELQRLGCEALAMDGAPDAEPLGESLGVEIIGADFETWSPDGHLGKFRLITLIHTFEHFYDPVAALRKLRRIVAPDGALFIRLPDHGVPGFERDLTPGHYSIHPFFHTLSSLRQVLVEAGGIFTIAEQNPLEPGQRDLILRPTALARDRVLPLANVPHKDSRKKPTAQSPGKAEGLPVIALHRPGAIGDILMTLNLIPPLRGQYPGHQIHYFCHPAYGASDALGGLLSEAGVDAVMDTAQFDAWVPRCARAISLIGYPLTEGYPDRPMERHLLEYFAAEMGIQCSELPALAARLPARPADAPNGPYATLQMSAGWSKYKEWPRQRWEQVQAALDFPIVTIGEEHGRTLAHSIALVANADLHIGIDSFANHLTHYSWRDGSGHGRRVPGVIVFGSTQASASGYPQNTNLTTALPCQPCFRENPALSRQPRGPCTNPPRPSYNDNTLPACLDGIGVAQVVTAILEAWNRRASF